MNLRTLIVDDEPLARDRLRGMLAKEPDLTVVGECASGPEAITAIQAAPPDLVFLDMQMPGCNGLQVLAHLPDENRPAIVFATAYEKFAVDAFDVQAVDYLLKPFDRERLQQALRRARDFLQRRLTPEAALPAPLPAPTKPDRITVKADGRLVFLAPAEIIRVEAADNYVMLHLTTGRLMLRETMAAIESRLGAGDFVRINRSALIQRAKIREIQPAQHGDYSVVLHDGTKLPLSRALRSRLEEIIPPGI